MASQTSRRERQDWPAYDGLDGEHYSPLTQINPRNVNHLRAVWTFDTGESGGLQTNPLVIGRTVYAFTPTQKVIALDGATGKKQWTFDCGTPGLQPARGLTYWSDGAHSILFAGLLSYLYALDPATGQPIKQFGEEGRVDLRKDLGAADVKTAFAAMTTPGVIYRDLIIVGFRAPETKPALHGDIRAYDVRTGKLRWIFHTVPHPGEKGYDSWPQDAWKYTGGANNWAGMAVDVQRGIVYAPTGSAVDDFYGADRLGDDHFADTLLALDANTGRRIWDFQGVHHDIWDRDFPSPPSLVTIQRQGKRIDAVAQTTKQGFLYLFDRATGAPLFPIEEIPFPASNVPGEHASPTQPVPHGPEPFARQMLTEEMLTVRTPEANASAVQQFRDFRSEGQFVPFSVGKRTIVFPGFDGGAEWGGSAVDIRTGVLYVNANDVPWTGSLVENKLGGSPGATVYQSQCSTCHGGDRRGSPPAFPSLTDIASRLSDAQIAAVVHNGKGRMPSFPNVGNAKLSALLEYLKSGKEEPAGLQNAALVSPDHSEAAGEKVYLHNCAICHGDDLMGAPSNYPGLIGVRTRMPDKQILTNIHDGKGRMPGFPGLREPDLSTLLRFLGQSSPDLVDTELSSGSSKKEVESISTASSEVPRYRFDGYRKFVDLDGYPAVKPPWGTLNAIDLNTGKYLWKVPLGNYPELVAKGLRDTGSENYGGPVVTAGGLIFIAATIYDHAIRAFDSKNGTLLWSAELPYAGNATPAIYNIDGRQYVVIATSNARNAQARQGSAYVAFALP